jgi:RimJ/RimL family protein N-acetyltransferase
VLVNERITGTQVPKGFCPGVTSAGEERPGGPSRPIRMSSAYDTGGKVDGTATRLSPAVPLLPIRVTLRSGACGAVRAMSGAADAARAAALLRHAIAVDRAWPFDSPLDALAFERYFCAHHAFVLDMDDDAVGGGGNSSSSSGGGGGGGGGVVGAFYIKPNFPGRCDHVCNGGFITDPGWRRRGVGEAMVHAFLAYARALGYRLVLFNLVFTTNTASIALWDKLGFTRLTTLPGVARLRKDGDPSADISLANDPDAFEYVDAYQYCLSLVEQKRPSPPAPTRKQDITRADERNGRNTPSI